MRDYFAAEITGPNFGKNITKYSEYSEIADELDALALRMRSTAAKMQAADDGVIVAHGNELEGASELAREWAKCIRVKV